MAFWKSTAKQRSARGHSIKKVFEATKHVSVSQGRVKQVEVTFEQNETDFDRHLWHPN